MEQIKIDGQYVNPYFMLDVVEGDTEQFITKAFKKKAKMWHPDKISKQDAKDPVKVQNIKHHFKVLVESYEYIITKIRSSHLGSNREDINVPKSNTILTKSIDNTSELNEFNSEFDKLRVTTPSDFGYNTERMTDVKDYDNFEYKPCKLNFGDSKNFNKDEFNKTFEYQQEFYNKNGSGELEVYHKTTDGFNAYNGSDLAGNACVSSYNGLMIVGDTFGQSGIGYYDSSYSDYKKTYEAPKNPDNINIPSDFKPSNKTTKPLSKSESKKQMELQMLNRQIEVNSKGKDKQAFKLQEQLLLDKQANDIKNKLESDKNMILQYQNLFTDKNLIQNALDGNLICNNDYSDEYRVNKRNLQTKFK
jgi:hypothetical protein